MIYDYQDILIVGDSFCGQRDDPTTWPYRLLNLLTGKNEKDTRGKGFSGCSWWSSRVELLKELQNGPCPKILIFTHTEPSRIPSDYNFPLNGTTVFDESYPDQGPRPINESAKNYFTSINDSLAFTKPIRNAAQHYYKYLYSGEFHEWTIYQWFDELDNKILPKYNIPIIIHLYSFEITSWTRHNQRYTFKNGVTTTESLFNLQEKIDHNEFSIYDRNHFPEKYNHIIANQLYDFIKNYNVNMNGKEFNFNLLGK